MTDVMMKLLQICDKKSEYAQRIFPYKGNGFILSLKLETIAPWKDKAFILYLKLDSLELSPKASFL